MIHRLVIGVAVASVLAGCSLFVSLDGLSDGGVDASAPDATPIDAAAATDASADAGSDAASYFVVDDCVADPSDVVDLTTAGTIDWAHWGSDADEKKVATHAIGSLEQSVNGNNPYPNDSRIFSWTDGTNVPGVASTSNGIYDDNGPMTLTVAASPTASLITVYIDTFSANATWAVAISSGAPSASQSLSGMSDDATRYRCAIHVLSATAATVVITFSIASEFDGGGGNLAMIAGTVSPE